MILRSVVSVTWSVLFNITWDMLSFISTYLFSVFFPLPFISLSSPPNLPFFFGVMTYPSSVTTSLFSIPLLLSLLSASPSIADVMSRITSGTKVPAVSQWWRSSRWCVWPWAPQLWWSCCSSWSSSALPRSSTYSRRRTRSCVNAGEAPWRVSAKTNTFLTTLTPVCHGSSLKVCQRKRFKKSLTKP